MCLVEGVGDEVLALVTALAAVCLVTLAWFSTRVRPVWNGNNSVWLVQMQTYPQRRVLQIVHIDDAERIGATEESPTNTRTIRIRASADAARPETSVADDVTQLDAASDNDDANESAQRTNATESSDAAAEPEESKGAEEPSTPGGDTTIRLKFLDETQRLVATFLSRSVGEFKRQYFGSEVSEGRVIRLIYQGQLLRDDSRSLSSYGLVDNCIVHCHVSNTPYDAGQSQPQQTTQTGQNFGGRRFEADDGGGGMRLGRFMYVLLAMKFGALWVFYVGCPQYFDFASLFSLVLCTVVYFVFLCSRSLRRLAHEQRRQREARQRAVQPTPTVIHPPQ